MTDNTKKTLHDYLNFKQNPALNSFQSLNDLKAELQALFAQLETAKTLFTDKLMAFQTNIVQLLKEINAQIVAGRLRGERGETGIKGDSGYTPIKGRDYFDGKAGRDAPTLEEILAQIPKPKDGIRGPRGEKGDKGDPTDIINADPLMFKTKLESLQGDDKLDASFIKNISAYLEPNAVKTALMRLVGNERLDAMHIKNIPRAEIRYGRTKLPTQSFNETPTGTPDGSTVIFTLANAPIGSSLQLFLNGQLLTQDVDFTISAKTITFGIAPSFNAVIRAYYQY